MSKKFHTVTVTPTLSTEQCSQNEVLFNLTEVPHAVAHHGGAAKLVSLAIQDKGDDAAVDYALYFFKSNEGGDLGTLGSAISITNPNLEKNKPLGVLTIEGIPANKGGDYLAGSLYSAKDLNLIVEAEAGSSSIYIAGKAIDQQTKEDGELVFTLGFEIL